MGPTALFDKSFLQSLSIDESVWLDRFFLCNICPIFYVETLADLKKAARNGLTPEQEVGRIAQKFPEMEGSPNVFHARLCQDNLMGGTVPMTGQIIMPGGRRVKESGKRGVVFQQSPEAEAFFRWQEGKFLEIERLYAKTWRKGLANLDLDEVAKAFRAIGISGMSCKGFPEAKVIAEGIVNSTGNPFELIRLALLFLNIPRTYHKEILRRWGNASYAPLSSYAPYAAYVLTIEVFFQIAVAAHLISSKRPSNRVDIAYLFYLPFCMVFISSDKLHRKCAPLFLRSDQQFVWGIDLKEDLKKLNDHYSQLSEAKKSKGIMSFADQPPREGEFLVASLWNRDCPRWRERREEPLPRDPAENKKIVEEINRMTEAPPLRPEEVDFDSRNADYLSIKHLVRKKKGSWWQLPKDFKLNEDAE